MVPARLIVSDLYELLGQDPAWTAGAQIVYAGCDYFNALWAVCHLGRVGAATPRQISDHPGDAAPAVSGQRVAFMSNRDGNWEIYVVNDDGSGLRRLTRNPANDGLPTSVARWSNAGVCLGSRRGLGRGPPTRMVLGSASCSVLGGEWPLTGKRNRSVGGRGFPTGGRSSDWGP